MKSIMWGVFRLEDGWTIHIVPSTPIGVLADGHVLKETCHCEPKKWFNDYGAEVHTHKHIN